MIEQRIISAAEARRQALDTMERADRLRGEERERDTTGALTMQAGIRTPAGVIDPTNTLAACLRRYRMNCNQTLAEVSKQAGISKTYLWELEADHAGNKRPSADVLTRIAGALGITWEELSGGKPRLQPRVMVSATIGLHQLKDALRQVMLDNEDFDVRLWGIYDAENFESFAGLIRREIAKREKAKEEGGRR